MSKSSEREEFRQVQIKLANERMRQYDLSPTKKMTDDLMAQQSKELELVTSACNVVDELHKFMKAKKCNTQD